MCRPVVKRVHTDCSFGLVCSSGLKCLLGMCPFLIILSLNIKQLVLTRLFTHASLINVCSSCLSHLCLMFYCKVECTSIQDVDRACWPRFLVDRASFSLCSLTALPCWPCFHSVILTVLASHGRRLSVHSIKLVQFHWPLCSLYHFICPRDLRPWCIASVSMSEKCNSMYPFLWKCPRILIILDIVHVRTCFNES